jgi:HSP90 family molecular chaperone
MQNSKKILEINPSHPAIKELFERVKDDPDKETEDLASVLFEGALINSGKYLTNILIRVLIKRASSFQ